MRLKASRRMRRATSMRRKRIRATCGNIQSSRRRLELKIDNGQLTMKTGSALVRDCQLSIFNCPLRYLSAAQICLALAFVSLPCAAEYPDRPVRVVVAQPAGGNADLVSRSFAQKLTDRFGVQFVVDNRGGAG